MKWVEQIHVVLQFLASGFVASPLILQCQTLPGVCVLGLPLTQYFCMGPARPQYRDTQQPPPYVMPGCE